MDVSRSVTDVICIVPARGGSRRIPGKNITNLHGKPLVAWIIDAAMTSNLFEHVYVSTEDPQIARVARSYGAEVPYTRPRQLARDNVSALKAAIDLMLYLRDKGVIYKTVCISAPTAPLLTAMDFVKAYQMFLRTKASVLHAVCELDSPPQWALEFDGELLGPMFDVNTFKKESQDLKKAYRIVGGIQLFQADLLLRERSYIGRPMVGYVVDRERGVDIDTIEDLELAQFYMERRGREPQHGKPRRWRDTRQPGTRGGLLGPRRGSGEARNTVEAK